MFISKRQRQFVLLAVFCGIVLLVTAIPLQADETKIPELNVSEQQSASSAEAPEGFIGKATYYKKRYNGRRTSSGVIYNQRKLTAAHPDIPFGTKVKVVNLANKRSVVVTINDRCPERSFEFIDLSRAAARKLGFLRKGVATVRIIPVEKPNGDSPS
jgi:rare lipoprotein A